MPLTSDTLTIGEARRIALTHRASPIPRPTGRVDRRHFRRVLDRLGLVQIDSVNVLTRSHELPFFARLGPYDRDALAGWLWGSGEVFEYWGHEASLLPVERHPLLRWRMAERQPGGWRRGARSSPSSRGRCGGRARPRPGHPRRLEHLGDADQAGQGGARGAGGAGARRSGRSSGCSGGARSPRSATRSTFEPHYVLPEQVIPADRAGGADPDDDDAMKALLLRGGPQPRRRHRP